MIRDVTSITNADKIRDKPANSGITKPLKVNDNLSTGVGSFPKLKYANSFTGDELTD